VTGFRVGTTSYIIPGDILHNVRFLANRVQDVELVLFEVDEGTSSLPSWEAVEELARLADRHDLTYTVHLPLDLRLGEGGSAGHRSLEKARWVIDRCRPLDPWAYVVHLGGKGLTDHGAWVDQAARALEIAAGWVGDPAPLAVENLEGYPLDFNEPVLDRVPVSRCIDVGHLWVDGHDPVPYIQRTLERARVVHLHGIGGRDHQSLAHVKPDGLRSVMRALEQGGFEGVLTLEVFNRKDFEVSIRAIQEFVGSWTAG